MSGPQCQYFIAEENKKDEKKMKRKPALPSEAVEKFHFASKFLFCSRYSMVFPACEKALRRPYYAWALAR